MIFYLLGLLSYYKLANKSVPASICLLFFAVITVPPSTPTDVAKPVAKLILKNTDCDEVAGNSAA